MINVICDRALLGAYSRETRRVSRRLVRRAAAEIRGQQYRSPLLRWAMPAIAAAAVIVVGASIWSFTGDRGAAVATVETPPALTEAAERPDPAVETPVAAIDPEPEPEPEPEPTLDEQLQLASGLTRSESAFAVLFDLWGLEFSGTTGDGCTLAEQAGYACLVQRGSCVPGRAGPR